jgi:uncharacterized protein YjiS (DUF1127 family)
MALNSILHQIGSRFQAWRERQRAVAELSSLDDRALADIGLRRGDIPYILLDNEADYVPVGRFVSSTPVNANTHGQRAA